MTELETRPNAEKFDSLLDALRSVGGAWARYGLSVGRAALETSARTLETTASALGDLAEAIERRLKDDRQAQDEDEPVVNRTQPWQ